MDILINNENEDIKISDSMLKKIEEALETALDLAGYGQDYEISISVVSPEEIRILNRDYRSVDKETDVLSFPLFERGQIPSSGMLGDIVISSQRVKEQAKEFNHSEEREFIYLSIHSLLHLLGYDHIEDDDRLEMRSKEKEIMKKLGIFK
ncbi:rRNA maturation RNase YbeY [Helcococcus massiliensis]|uniref:rRNA maturation RNase YbeY n=1 Tax=Helcococcus massiliensis TaxID=2040290 RepID=UPI000CDE5B8F|nr:rRNA maturation RNase YbeY [Helcococcus massiliensis]